MLRPNLKILDIACGAGYGTHLLAGKANSVTGVDASVEAIDFAKSVWPHERASFYVASTGQWFAQDHAKYDAVVTFETVEHMYDARLFLNAIWSRLRDGGVLFLSSPNAAFYPLTDNEFHIRHFNTEELESLLRTLPNVADFRIWPQGGGVIGPKVRSGRFLVSAVAKAGTDSALGQSLDEVTPFHVAAIPVRRSFRIGAESFSTNTNIGTKGPNEITSSFAASGGCIVFGPYHKLLAGRYAVQFDLSISGERKVGAGEITIEVTNTQDELMARLNLSPEQLINPSANSYTLRFHNRRPHVPIEFRVHASGKPVSGILHFKGVNVQRVD
jgi:SAM-dependent methyltransferase